MVRRAFSDEDIEQLKVTPYVKPNPLTMPAILLLILFFPVGLYYLVRKQTPEHMLSHCRTDQEREALFAYLKTSPETYEKNNLSQYKLSLLNLDDSYFSVTGVWSYIPGTYGYKVKRGFYS